MENIVACLFAERMIEKLGVDNTVKVTRTMDRSRSWIYECVAERAQGLE